MRKRNSPRRRRTQVPPPPPETALPALAPAPPLPATPRGRLPAPERREAILKAALPLFARRGWLGTGTRELARAAGVTEPVLYRHFPDKEALFLAVLSGAAASLEAVLTRRLAAARTAAERLECLALGLSDILDRHLDDLRVLSGAASALDHAEVTGAARRHLSALAEHLGRGIAGPGLAADVDASTAGALLLEVGLGAAVLWPLEVPVTLRPDFRRRALGLLLRAFTGRAPG